MWLHKALEIIVKPQNSHYVSFGVCGNTNKLASCSFSTSDVIYYNPETFKLPKGSLKKKYLKKFPLIKKDSDGNYSVEGVSNKQIACPVNWHEPTKIERFRPGEDSSGDLGNLNSLVNESTLKKTNPRLEYQYNNELIENPPEVKKVLSLEFGRHKDIVEKIKHELTRRVQEHPLDFTSLPVKIAEMTANIRNHQEALINLNDRPTGRKRNQARRHALDILISHRNNCLSRLRERDYKKYEWLLETLNIVHKPRPGENYEQIERRKHQDRLTDLWCDELRTYRLQVFKKELNKKQPEFLRRKAALLREILDEEEKLGETPTVSVKDIEELQAKANAIEKTLSESDTSETELFIYKEKIISQDLQFVK